MVLIILIFCYQEVTFDTEDVAEMRRKAYYNLYLTCLYNCPLFYSKAGNLAYLCYCSCSGLHLQVEQQNELVENKEGDSLKCSLLPHPLQSTPPKTDMSRANLETIVKTTQGGNKKIVVE
uniref:Uncharacterized protein n=1 Tax=Strigamia maritima TaxID=126957 RepID=T1J2A6_STRMM